MIYTYCTHQSYEISSIYDREHVFFFFFFFFVFCFFFFFFFFFFFCFFFFLRMSLRSSQLMGSQFMHIDQLESLYESYGSKNSPGVTGVKRSYFIKNIITRLSYIARPQDSYMSSLSTYVMGSNVNLVSLGSIGHFHQKKKNDITHYICNSIHRLTIGLIHVDH